MRISSDIAAFFKSEARSIDDQAEVYLFGSRVDDSKKGGDIDIMILSHNAFNKQQLNKIRWRFYDKFGEQKLDIVSYAKSDSDNFKELVLLEAEKL